MKHAPFPKLQALSAVRDDRTLGKTEKLVLVMLISRSDARGESYPSLDTLADDCALARSVVADVVRSVSQRTSGRVQVTVQHQARKDGSGGRASNLYRLTLSPAAGLNRAEVKSATQTQEGGGLSPKSKGVESEKGGGLSPAAGLEALQEALQEALHTPRKRDAGEKTATDPRVKQLWDYYHAEHQRLRGVAPVFAPKQRGAVGNAFKQTLAVLSLEDAKAVVTRALGEGFHIQPTAILANLNRYRGQQRGNVRKFEPQRGIAGGLRPEQLGQDGARAYGIGGGE